MLATTNDTNLVQSSTTWLKSYYFIRFAVSTAWVLLAFTVAKAMPPLAAIMLVAYPAWDALANFIDAQRTGGLNRNKTQLLNFVISIITTVAGIDTDGFSGDGGPASVAAPV